MSDSLIVAVETGLLGAAPALALVGIGGRRFVAPALALGVGVVFVVFKGWPELPHRLWVGNNDGMAWLGWALVVAGLIGWLQDLRWLPHGFFALLGFLTCCALPVFVSARLHALFADVSPRWTGWTVGGHLGPAIALLIAAWVLMVRASERRQGLLLPIVWTLCLTADSLALLHSGSALQGQLAGGLAAALGMATATAIWRRPFALGDGAVLVLAAGHIGLVFAGHHLGELERWPALALALAPATVWLGGARELARWPRLGGLVAAVVALAASGYAVWATWRAGGGY